MAITWTIDGQKRQVHITLTKPYTRESARVVATAIASDPTFDTQCGFLIDAFGPIGPSFVQDVARFFLTHREKFSGARVAVVLRLGEKAASHGSPGPQTPDLPVTLRVFRSYKSAERWLAGTD